MVFCRLKSRRPSPSALPLRYPGQRVWKGWSNGTPVPHPPQKSCFGTLDFEEFCEASMRIKGSYWSTLQSSPPYCAETHLRLTILKRGAAFKRTIFSGGYLGRCRASAGTKRASFRRPLGLGRTPGALFRGAVRALFGRCSSAIRAPRPSTVGRRWGAANFLATRRSTKLEPMFP